MTQSPRTRAFAPVTSANLAVGFDVLGVALRPLTNELWGDVVTVETTAHREGEPGRKAGALTVSISGPYRDDLPEDPESNLIYPVAQRFLKEVREKGVVPPPLHLHLEKRLPIGSGLGSSASSSVATVVALQHHFGEILDERALLALAGFGEGIVTGTEHLDNVGPSLLGGLCIMGPEGRVVKYPWPTELLFVLVTPEFSIVTRDAREALPAQVSLSDATLALRRLASFLGALVTRDRDLISLSLRDELIEPARRHLLPGFDDAQKEALHSGALGCSFSGSGPTVFAIAVGEKEANKIGEAMVESFGRAGLAAGFRLAAVDEEGARTLELDGDGGQGL